MYIYGLYRVMEKKTETTTMGLYKGHSGGYKPTHARALFGGGGEGSEFKGCRVWVLRL